MKRNSDSARPPAQGQAEASNPGADLTSHPELEFVRDSRAARLTIAGCCALVAFTLVWAAQVKIEEKVTGSGLIEPTGQIERIEHPDGGVVRLLTARENDVLPAGAVLLQFDTDHIARETEALTARIETLENEADRVDFLMRADGTEPPETVRASDIASEAFWSEQAYLFVQLQRIASEDERLAAQLQGMAARSKLLTQERTIVGEQLARYAQFADNGTVRRLDHERLRREHLQLDRAVSEALSQVEEIISARRENDMRRDELLAQRRRDAAVRRTKIEEELVSLRQTAADAAARIARAEVRTIGGGKVQLLEVRNANEVVAPGDTIAEIVPQRSTYRAVVDVSADRIGSVRTGMSVRLKIVSYDFTRYGAISAQVSDVSPTSFVNEAGEVVFRVNVDLPQRVPTGSEAVSVRAGMTVTADILTGQRSILSYLLHPMRRVQDEALSEA